MSKKDFRYSRTARTSQEVNETIDHLERKGYEVLTRPNEQTGYVDIYYHKASQRMERL